MSPKQQGSYLRLLVNSGIAHSQWASVKDAERILKIPKGRLYRSFNGVGKAVDTCLAAVTDYLKLREIPLPDPDNTGPPEEEVSSETAASLYLLGKKRQLWDSMTSCAARLDLSRDTVSKLINDPAAFQETPRSRVYYQHQLQKLVAVTRSPKARKLPKQNFKDLYEKGVEQGTWKGVGECASATGIDRGTVSKNLKRDPKKYCKTERSRKMYERACHKLAMLVNDSPAEEKQPVRRPILSPSPTSVPSHLAVESAAPAPAGVAMNVQQAIHVLATSLIEQVSLSLRDEVKQAVHEALPQQPPTQNGEAPQGVVPSSWVDDVIAGRKEFEGQHLENVRFVLTTPPFQKLLARYSGEEVADTKGMIERVIIPAAMEVRRRLNNSSQTTGSHAAEVRDLASAINALVRELVLLIRAAEQHRECNLSESYGLYLEGLETLI